MPSLDDLKKRISSVKSTQKITKAMKMVAAAKLRKSQERMERARPYSSRMENLISHLLKDVDRSILTLLTVPEKINTYGFLIVTADRGLAGSFNTNIIKKAEIEINKIGKENAQLFCIGKKGYEHFNKRNYNIINHYKDFWSSLEYGQAMTIGSDIISSFINNEIDTVNVVYNYFKSTASQKIIYEKLLPLVFENNNSNLSSDIIYEPSKIEIVKSLVPKYFNIEIWKYLLESFASEQAARMLAMENATENAKDMINDLNLEFNKARQTAITTEMLEIVGGAEALSN